MAALGPRKGWLLVLRQSGSLHLVKGEVLARDLDLGAPYDGADGLLDQLLGGVVAVLRERVATGCSFSVAHLRDWQERPIEARALRLAAVAEGGPALRLRVRLEVGLTAVQHLHRGQSALCFRCEGTREVRRPAALRGLCVTWMVFWAQAVGSFSPPALLVLFRLGLREMGGILPLDLAPSFVWMMSVGHVLQRDHRLGRRGVHEVVRPMLDRLLIIVEIGLRSSRVEGLRRASTRGLAVHLRLREHRGVHRIWRRLLQ